MPIVIGLRCVSIQFHYLILKSLEEENIKFSSKERAIELTTSSCLPMILLSFKLNKFHFLIVLSLEQENKYYSYLVKIKSLIISS